MTPGPEQRPVVVGVDGSRASLNAARWAAAEALSRDVPLRLVHVVPAAQPQTAFAATGPDACCADLALLSAEDEVNDVGKPERLELARIPGKPDEVLIGESASALMICLGAPRLYRLAGRLFGATATALAEGAHCPVALIRPDADGSSRDDGVFSVVLNDEPDNDAVVHLAMHKGRLGNAVVRQVDRRLNSWIRRYPDVPVETVAAGTGGQNRNSAHQRAGLQLAVMGQADADDIGTLTVPNCHPILDYSPRSVLVVGD